jgi:hypothetical protein
MRQGAVLLSGIVAAAISTSCANATMWITGDRGGTVLDYAERFRQARAAGEQVIIDGNCLSACTMVIGMLPRDRVCATSKAVLGFHAAFRPTSDGRKVASTDATQFMMNTYPPELRKWISQRGGLTTQMLFLRGPELASFVPKCGTSVGAFGVFERLWR